MMTSSRQLGWFSSFMSIETLISNLTHSPNGPSLGQLPTILDHNLGIRFAGTIDVQLLHSLDNIISIDDLPKHNMFSIQPFRLRKRDEKLRTVCVSAGVR